MNEMLPTFKNAEAAVQKSDKNVPFNPGVGSDPDIEQFFTQQEEDGLAGLPVNANDPKAVEIEKGEPIDNFFAEADAAQVRNTLEAVKQYEPEQFAKAKELGAKYNLDGRTVYDNMDLVEKDQSKISKAVNKALQNQPQLAELFKDPEFAAVAQADPDLLDHIQDYASAATHGAISGLTEGFYGLGQMADSSKNLMQVTLDAMFPAALMGAEGVASLLKGEPTQYRDLPIGESLIQAGDAGTQFSNETFKLDESESSYGTEVIEAMGQMTTQIASAVLSPYVAVPLIAGQGAAQQGRRIEALENKGEEISSLNRTGAIWTGAGITAATEFGPIKLITKSLPKPLRDKVAELPGANVFDKVVDKLPGPQKNIVIERMRTGLQAAGAEGAQEFTEGVLQEIASQVWLIPDKTIMEGLEDEIQGIIHGSGVAATSAGAMDLLMALIFKRRAQGTILENEQAEQVKTSLDKLAEITSDSTLQKMAPDEFKKMMAKKFGDESIKITNEGVQELFQSLPPEERGALLENIQGLEQQLVEANELGTDIDISMADYATYVATQPYHEVLSRHAKVAYSDKTLAEVEASRDDFVSSITPDLQGEIDQQKRPEKGEFDDIAEQVKQHVTEQLEQSGQSINIAQFPAELFSAAVPAMASRGADAQQIATAITNLVVRSPLSIEKTSQDTITADIQDVLQGNYADERQMFGRSLQDFLRDVGINDAGGELAARDVDVGLPRFTRRMQNTETGVDLDRAVEMAIEAGYLPGVDPTQAGPEQLLEALDRDLAGDPEFSTLSRNNDAIKRNEYLESLEDYIRDLGLENATVDEIREAIRQDTLSEDKQEGTVTQFTVEELPPLPDNYSVNEEQLEIDFTPPTYEQAVADPEQVADETIMELRNIQGSVLANKMVKDFEAEHATRLVGQKVASSNDLAALAQIYRNPAFETFRIFFVKDGQVVHQDGITSRKVGSSGVFADGESFAHVNQLMESTGADGYYLMHNHPSGNTLMSGEDKAVTQQFADQVPGFLSHIIINGETYNVISGGSEGRFDMADLGPVWNFLHLVEINGAEVDVKPSDLSGVDAHGFAQEYIDNLPTDVLNAELTGEQLSRVNGLLETDLEQGVEWSTVFDIASDGLGSIIESFQSSDMSSEAFGDNIETLPEDLQNYMYDLNAEPKVPNAVLGENIMSAAKVAGVGKQFQKPGFFTLIGADSPGNVSTIMDIPLEAVDLSPADVQANMNKIALETGTRMFFAANVPDSHQDQFHEGLFNGLFTDVISESGVSYQQDLRINAGQPMSGTARRTMFQGATTAWDAMSDRQREVVTEHLAKLEDGAEKKELLVRFAGTPWEKQATAGILTRASIDMLLAGVEPDFESTLRAPSGKKLYDAIKNHGEVGIWSYLAGTSMIGHASKPVNAINASFINCKPSADCANFCYAATGRNFPVNVNKAELVTWAVENNPKRAADRVSREYRAMPEFEAHKALRLFDKGDGDKAWLPFIQALNDKGVRTHIFSKNPEFLRQVPESNLRLLSIDNSNMEMASENKDLELAFVYDGSQGAQAFAEQHEKQLGVVLPIKLGKKTTGKALVEKLTPLAKRKTCPIDSGYKEIGTGQGKWNCTSCDRNGGVGCFDGTTTKMVLDALSNGSGQDLEVKIEELRNVAGQLTGRQREVFLSQLDSLVSTIRAGAEPTTEVYNTEELPGASEKARYKQQQRIDIKELFQSAYHGTPHRNIDKFSTENIGTGEGTQMYGWGLYFASNKEIAEYYRKALTPDRVADEIDNIHDIGAFSEEYEAALDDGEYTGDTKELLEALREQDWMGYDLPGQAIQAVLNDDHMYILPERLQKAVDSMGQLHAVEVPDSDVLLDYDVRLSEMPQGVQDKLKAPGAFLFDQYPRTSEIIEFDGTGKSIQKALEEDIIDQLGGDRVARNSAPQQASEKLNSIGIPGLQYADAGSRRGDKSSKNFVVWNDDAVDMAQTFYQGQGDKRGSIELPGNVMNEQTVINLFEKADLSTMLHESGHFFLELHRELAKQGGQIAEDHERVKEWWHKNAASLAVEAGLTEGQIIKYIFEGKLDTEEQTMQAETALHEQWARAFESYLMTGKAPSLKLQNSFQQFKAWLLSVYRSIKRLNVNVTPELAGVFDRMLATDKEIAEANEAMEYSDVLSQSNLLDEEEKEQLKNQSRKATEESQSQLLRAHLRHEKAQLSRAYKARREVVKKQVENEVRSRQPYRTQKLIIFGVDPDDNQVDAKLNSKALTDIVGKTAVKMLGKKFGYGKYGISRKDGVNPMSVAETMGYGSVEQMVDDLLTLPKFTETVQAETDQIMQAEFLAKEQQVVDQAIAAAHGNERQKLLENELDILTTQAGARTSSSQLMKAAAIREINKKRITDIQPYRYKQAEVKAARDAERAILSQDVQAARLAKAKQLMNFHLFNEATNAREYVEAAQKGINKYRKTSVRKLVDPEYMEQIDGILFNFEFRSSISQKAFEKSKAVAAFVRRQEDDGKSIYLSDKMIVAIEESYKEHYRNLPLSEFKGIDDAIKNLRHLSDVKMELKEKQAQREYAALKESMLVSIEANNNRRTARAISSETVADKFKDKLSAFNAYMLSPEQIFRQMDGDKLGPLYNNIFKPVSDAADKAAEWKSEMGTWFSELARKHYKRRELARFSGAGAKRYVVKVGGRDQAFTKEDLLGVALNTGNENNRFKLLDGYQMHETELATILALLEKRDWDFVQALWDKLDSEFWGPLSQVEKRVNGVAPEKVEPAPFVNKHGSYAGGYWPIKYDAKEDPQQQKFDDKATLGDVLGQAIHANTRQGHAQGRVQQTGKRVRIDFQGVLTQHVNDVIQDITHRESVTEVWKLVTDRDIADQMIAYFGSDVYKTIKPWLAETVGAGKPLATQGQRLIRHLRVGMSVVTMGASVKTAIQNLSGLFISVRHVPPGKLMKNFVTNTTAGMTQGVADTVGWTAKAIGVPEITVAKYMDRLARNPATFIEQQKEILAMSPYLRQRAGQMDSDVQQELRKLSLKGTFTPSTQFMFGLITMVDKAVVLPTWQAAYEDGITNKNMDQSEAITHADHIVRMTQGSARSVDMSRIIADKDTMALFTNFFSYFNAMYSLYWRQKKMFGRKGAKHMPQFLAEMFFIVIAPALVAEWLAGRAPEEEENYAAWALRNSVLYPAMSLPLIRDIATPVYAALDDTAPQYGYNLSPMSAIGEGVFKSLAAGADGEITKYEAKQMFVTPGYFLHLPTVQAWRTSEHAFNVATGESDFSMYDLLYGEKK